MLFWRAVVCGAFKLYCFILRGVSNVLSISVISIGGDKQLQQKIKNNLHVGRLYYWTVVFDCINRCIFSGCMFTVTHVLNPFVASVF